MIRRRLVTAILLLVASDTMVGAQVFTWERTPSRETLYQVEEDALVESVTLERKEFPDLSDDAVDVWIVEGSLVKQMIRHVTVPGAESRIDFSLQLQARGDAIKVIALEVVQPLTVDSSSPESSLFTVRAQAPYTGDPVNLKVTARGSCHFLAVVGLDGSGKELIRKLVPWRKRAHAIGTQRPALPGVPPPPVLPKDFLQKPFFDPEAP